MSNQMAVAWYSWPLSGHLLFERKIDGLLVRSGETQVNRIPGDSEALRGSEQDGLMNKQDGDRWVEEVSDVSRPHTHLG